MFETQPLPNESAANLSDPVVPAAQVDPAAQQAVSQPEAHPYTPEQILELEQYAIAITRQNEELKGLKKYEKYQSHLDRLEEDSEFRSFQESASQYWDQNRQQQPAAQTPASSAQLPKELDEVVGYVREARAREKAQQEEQFNRFYAEQRVAERKLRRDYGLNDQQIALLADNADTMARRNGRMVGLEEAYSTLSSLAPKAGNTPPTVGLRGDSSQPGVPGPSSDLQAFKSDFHGALTARLRAGN